MDYRSGDHDDIEPKVHNLVEDAVVTVYSGALAI